MNLTSQILAIVLIAVCLVTAVADFRRVESIMATMERLKVPANAVPLLGSIKVVAAIGMAVGLVVERLGQVTGVALAAYFAIAVTTHVRVKDGVANTLPAFVLLVSSLLFVLTSIAA